MIKSYTKNPINDDDDDDDFYSLENYTCNLKPVKTQLRSIANGKLSCLLAFVVSYLFLSRL